MRGSENKEKAMKRNLKSLLCLACLAVLVCFASVGRADVLTTRAGTLASAQTSTGVSANSVVADGATALYVEYVITGTASVLLRQMIPGGTNALPVVDSTQTANVILKIDKPAGVFDASSTISSGTVTVKYATVQER